MAGSKADRSVAVASRRMAARRASRQAGRLAKESQRNIEAATEGPQEPSGATIGGPAGVGKLSKADLRRMVLQRNHGGSS